MASAALAAREAEASECSEVELEGPEVGHPFQVHRLEKIQKSSPFVSHAVGTSPFFILLFPVDILYSISGRSLNHLSRRADASGNTLCCSHPLHSSTASHDLSTASFGVPRPHVALAPAAGGKSLCLDSACASAPLSGGKKCSRAWQGVEVWKRVDFQEPKGLPMIA